MTSEKLLIAALLKDRQAYDTFTRFGDHKSLSSVGGSIVRIVGDYYGTDPAARHCPRAFVESRVLRDIKSSKHDAAFRDYLTEVPDDVSGVNVEREIRASRRQAVGARLSLACANGQPDEEIEKIIEEWQQAGEAKAAGEDRELVDVFDTKDLTEPSEENTEAFVKLWPKALNDKVAGRCRRGHHILVFARPESGKTAFAINLVVGFLRQGLNVLYVGNEEPAADIRDRIRARVLKSDRASLGQEAGRAIQKLLEDGTLGKVRVVGGVSTFASVRAALKEDDYGVVVFDQVRGMRLKADSRTNELEAAATEARAVAREFNVVAVSVTQAGDSATGRVFLNMSDVDSSKTGIPGAVDLMIGLGKDDVLEANNMLGVSLCKNKLSGEHAKFNVSVNFATGEIC